MDTAKLAAPPGVEPGPHRFASLGPRFSTALPAAALPDVQWVATSDACAALLGWPADWWRRPEWQAAEVMRGAATWPGMHPIASVYCGHQVGVWAGQLGDGRALLLGDVQTAHGPMELQLKGSGRTPYSRMGDGRAVLRSTVREYLCSEAMAALGIPTTRALCMLASPQPVRRESIETAALLTRVAPSFLRFGHFEHFAHSARDADALRRLVAFTIEHHYPECADAADPVAALLEAVVRRTARLMAQWHAVGFCHGVMNTDNMSMLGLTIDYGPFGFLDGFDPMHVCNHSDDRGRYAFARQPAVAQWNLHALAQALIYAAPASSAPASDDELQGAGERLGAALAPYAQEFEHTLATLLRAKLGLMEAREDDGALADDLLRLMAAARADFTISFRRLGAFSSAQGAGNEPLRDQFIDRDAFDAWAARYAARLRAEGSIDAERAARMNRVNPKYILRNHLAQRAIEQAQQGDYEEVRRLARVLEHPFDEQPEHEAYAGFAPDWARDLEVSCSS